MGSWAWVVFNCFKTVIIHGFYNKVQHGDNTASICSLFNRNDRVFTVFLLIYTPRPQTQGCIFLILEQKDVKTVKNSENTLKPMKTRHFRKPLLLHSLVLSLLHSSPNMATNCRLWSLVFKTKEAW